jgi:hypothetical protein
MPQVPKIPFHVSDLLVHVNGEMQSCVTTLTVDAQGSGIVELHGGKSVFGKIDLSIDKATILRRIADSEADHE